MPITLTHNNYGKSEIRLVKVVRRPDCHELRDLTVDVALEGDFDAAHIEGDNTGLLATDTMRNTVYALAKEDPIDDIESFGVRLVKHFLAASPAVGRARVNIVEHPWARLEVDGHPHQHAFQRSNGGDRVATVSGEEGEIRVEAGIDDLLVLKTTGSGWEGYLHDRYTSLPETSDRILATVITARWSYGETGVAFSQAWHAVRRVILETFGDHYSPSVQFTLHRMGRAVLEAVPEVERIHFSLPNKHHIRYELDRFGLENDNEIFHATTEPYGLIEGTVERVHEAVPVNANGTAAGPVGLTRGPLN
jgi:urate oxidase